MSKFYKFINEKRNNNVISVDIQPMYESYINFDLYNFFEWLSAQRNILYFYNGPETVGIDKEKDIINWMIEYGYPYEKINDITFYDKGYGFFRSWIDNGIDDRTLQKVILHMINNRFWDSRDIPEEDIKKLLGQDINFYYDDSIFVPDIPMNVLKKYSGSYLVGGGIQECLKEVQILMNTLNIKYKLMRRYIYG